MPISIPEAIAETAELAQAKAAGVTRPPRFLVSAMLAGAYIGIGIVVCSLAMLYGYFSRTDRNSEETAKVSRVELARALGAWLAFVATIILLPLIGFGLSLGLLTAFLILVLDRRSPWLAIGVALGLALGFHLVFPVALGVSLPRGPWGF